MKHRFVLTLVLLSCFQLGCVSTTKSIDINKNNMEQKDVIVEPAKVVIEEKKARKRPTDLFTHYPSESQMVAIIYGEFVLKNNCLLLELTGQDAFITPVFPQGKATFLIEENAVMLGDIKVPLDVQVGTGGGALPKNNVVYATKGDASCLTDRVFITDADVIAIEEDTTIK
ncbi:MULTISPECIES: hypothetical protein [Psychrobacter]|jgi:hypothetical protein|uniref:Lipoprotein n=2 Tax=Psychrobacter TaxID=497 RepID=A0ABT6IVG8_9GAMM|nr:MULTISPECIES: hypothetical protein [Psychrobacter]MDH4905809.1 hypothetical protein [Psychrobacter pocilloporae]HBD04095.1 hypothetical protein [Psychrobacter sp.]HBL96015.1 hypothetical protein [Psychrobacter sp.]|tara:strand:+ start:336 stop:848 length:513 start_codon:yes stop_codon:yes gene_type:complete